MESSQTTTRFDHDGSTRDADIDAVVDSGFRDASDADASDDAGTMYPDNVFIGTMCGANGSCGCREGMSCSPLTTCSDGVWQTGLCGGGVGVQCCLPYSCTFEEVDFIAEEERLGDCQSGASAGDTRGHATRHVCQVDGRWEYTGYVPASESCRVSDAGGNNYRICDGESVVICPDAACNVRCDNGRLVTIN